MPITRGLPLNRFLQAMHLFHEKGFYLLPVEYLPFEQGFGNDVQGIDVVEEDGPRLFEASAHDRLQLGVYLVRRVLAEVPLALHLLAQEDGLLFSPVVERSELLAHAPFADHLPRDLSGPP